MSKRIFAAGHQGMVGSAIVRQLSEEPSIELITRSRAELDLSMQQAVAEFIYDNLWTTASSRIWDGSCSTG